MAPRRLRPGPPTALAALALVAAGCGSAPPDGSAAAPAADTVKVVASTDVYGAIARAVGGDRVDVVSIIDAPGTDPHEYEATPADAAQVTDAAIVIGNGGGYDAFVPQLVESAGGRAHLIDVSALAGNEEPAGEQEHAGEEPSTHAGEEPGAHAGEEPGAHAGEEPGAHEHGTGNEHVWYELPAMATLAETLAAELGEASPADAATFTANAAAFGDGIAGLQARVDAIRAAHEGTRVAVTEPLPLYLLEDAGLVNAAPEGFTQAIEEGSDPPAATVAEMLALFSGRPVEALVLNTQTQSPATDRVRQAAEAAGVPVVEMGETLAEGQNDYLVWMETQIDALASALSAAP